MSRYSGAFSKFSFENQRVPADESVFVELWSLVIVTWVSFSAFVGSLALGMTWLASPLPGYLCDRVGCRIANFIRGTLCVTCLVLTSFSHSLNLMYFTHSLVFGLGICFIYNCSYLVIAQYFKGKLSMATGIVALAGGKCGCPIHRSIASSGRPLGLGYHREAFWAPCCLTSTWMTLIILCRAVL